MTLVMPGLKPAYGLEWEERRRAYRAKHPAVCAACGDKRGCRLHHRTYRRLVPIADRPGYGLSGGEHDRDLTWLCSPGCHERVHWWHDQLPWRDPLPYRWLGLVTTLYIVMRQVRARITPTIAFAVGWLVTWRIGWWVAGLFALAFAGLRIRRGFKGG